MKKIINKLSIFLYPLAKTYWFIRRPKTAGVKIILEKENKVLLVKHSYIPKASWTFPGRKIEQGEDPRDTTKREVKEELGLDLKEVEQIGKFISRKEYKVDTIYVFRAEVEEIDLIIDDFEIKEAKWFNKDKLPILPSVALRVWKIYKNEFK